MLRVESQQNIWKTCITLNVRRCLLLSLKLFFHIDYKDENFICHYKKVFGNVDLHNKGLILLGLLAY